MSAGTPSGGIEISFVPDRSQVDAYLNQLRQGVQVPLGFTGTPPTAPAGQAPFAGSAPFNQASPVGQGVNVAQFQQVANAFQQAAAQLNQAAQALSRTFQQAQSGGAAPAAGPAGSVPEDYGQPAGGGRGLFSPGGLARYA